MGNKNKRQPANNKKRSFPSKVRRDGGKFSPSSNPPDTTYQPWFPVCLVEVSGPGLYTFEKLVNTLRKQLDPTDSGFIALAYFKILFRLQEISVWNLTGRTVSLTVVDDIASTSADNSDYLGGWVDCGGPNSFPCIGYKYPASHSNKVHHFNLDASRTTVLFITTASADSDRILTHFKVLFRFSGSSSFKPEVEIPGVQDLVDSLRGVSRVLRTSERKNKTSFVDTVIDGVKKTAAVVYTVSGGRLLVVQDEDKTSESSAVGAESVQKIVSSRPTQTLISDFTEVVSLSSEVSDNEDQLHC